MHKVWLGKPMPRYTSYPPATTFHEGVTATDYRAALEALGPDEPVSLYLHIPFCRSLCLYCGCHTSVTQRPERVTAYLEALTREMASVAGCLGQRRVSHIHLGGGSPNILSEAAFENLFSALNRLFAFGSCREVAVEIDPRLITPKQIQTLAKVGVTRVSLGIQDFNGKVQQAVQREQPYAMIAEACDALHHSGIGAINFDLMYGLPFQTTKTLEETAERTVRLRPDRLALFSYAHVPFLKPHQRSLEAHGLPDEQARLDMEQAARRVFVEAGYKEIGMDHFALPHDSLAKAATGHRLHRNFQGYTDDDSSTLIGLGASAISRTPVGYFQNEKDIETYQRLTASPSPIVRGIILTPDDRFRAAIIEQLMCEMVCDLPQALLEPEFSALTPYIKAGLIETEGSRLRLTSPHRMAIRAIANVFDRYKAGNAASRVA